MSEGKNVPKIRFPGFQGEWEEFTISDIFDKKTQKNRSQSVTNVITNSAEFGLIPQKDFFDKEIAVEGSTENYTIIEEGDFVYNPRKSSFAPMGPFNRYEYGEKGIVSPLYSCLSSKGVVNSDFLLWYFKTDKWHSYVKDHGAQNGARHDRVGMTDKILMGIPVIAPQKSEQTKISSFLSKVDLVIWTQQQELDKWKELKKGMLQKMFPKEGESVPEIRFPGFSDCWEKCKLSSASELITVGIANSATHAYTNSGIIMFRNQNIKQNHLDDEDLIHINSAFEKGYEKKRIRENDILVTRTGNPGIACVVPKKYEGSQTFTTLILRLKNDISPRYVCQYINSDYGKQFFMSTQIGGGQKNTGAGILEEFPLVIPGRYEEQEMIADYLFRIDYLIMNQQRELNKWKELKKGLLQQMFV